ncbi:MAG TPA: FtsX-like permease family protein [Jiangellales bacterium]|nr:FtsX-like permease family protein [Jiangellales bacterium]
MLTALVAATLLITASVLSPAVAEQTFRGTVATAPPEDHDLRASTAFNADTWTEIDGKVRDVVEQHGDLVDGLTAALWTTASHRQDEGADGGDRIAFGAVADVDTHAELVDGRWPEPGATPVEAVLHADALARLGLEVGDSMSIDLFTGATDTADVIVVGSFLPVQREHVLWRGMGHGVQLEGEDSTSVFGPVLIPVDDLAERIRPGSTTAAWTVRLDLSQVSFDSANAAIRSMARLRAGLADVPTGDRATKVSVGGGTEVLELAREAAASARSVLLVIVTMITVLAAWALMFTARILAASRASVIALFRARGGPDRLVARLSILSAILPALVVAIAAPLVAELALGVLRRRDLVAASGGLEPWLLSIAVAAAWLGVVVVADLRSATTVRHVSAEAARPTRRAAVQRAGLDIVVLALGLLGLQQLRRPAGEAPDVVLIVAPAALVLAGAFVLVRFLPWFSRAAAALAGRTRGLSAVLGSFEIARRPLRHVAAVAMLALALAAAVFAATTQASWNVFRDDTVALAEPADLRVAMEPALVIDRPVAATADMLRALPDVQQVMPVHLETGRSDTRRVELVGVDPALAGDLMRWPSAVADSSIADLLAALPGQGDLAAVVTRRYAEELGLGVEGIAVVNVRGVALRVRVAGLVEAVPGSTEPYAMLVDQEALRLSLAEWVEVLEEGADAPELQEVAPAPNQWWLGTVNDGSAAAGAAAGLPGVTATSTYAEARRSSNLEVTARGVFAGLSGGLAFAAAFGIVGAVLHAVASYRSRAGEHAVLRAVGLRRSTTVVSIAVEQSLLLGFATIVGLGLGALVSWLTVPRTIGRLAGLPEVPPLELTVPWQILAALGFGAIVLLGSIVVVAAASLRTVSITSVLRAGEEV